MSCVLDKSLGVNYLCGSDGAAVNDAAPKLKKKKRKLDSTIESTEAADLSAPVEAGTP